DRRSAPRRLAANKRAASRLAKLRSARVITAKLRSALTILAANRLAPFRSALVKTAKRRSAPLRSAPRRLASRKFASNNCAPNKPGLKPRLRITSFHEQYPVIPLATRSCCGVRFQHFPCLCWHVTIQFDPVRIVESVFELHAIGPPDDPGPTDRHSIV